MQVRSGDLKDMVVLVVGCGTPGGIGLASLKLWQTRAPPWLSVEELVRFDRKSFGRLAAVVNAAVATNLLNRDRGAIACGRSATARA
jgi:hypothetical protein